MFKRATLICGVVLLGTMWQFAFAQLYGQNPEMDMRIRMDHHRCDDDSAACLLWFEVRSVSDSSYRILQVQNSVFLTVELAGRVVSVVDTAWGLSTDDYSHQWRFVQAEGVLEFLASHIEGQPYQSLGNADSTIWSPVVVFKITFLPQQGISGMIRWWWDTPYFNIRALRNAPQTGSYTIHRYELADSLQIPLYCETPDEAEIQILKTVDSTHPKIGDLVTFTIAVHNNGPDAADSVVVHDELPLGVQYVSDNSGGAYNPATGLWIAGALATGGTKTLQISATVVKGNPFENCAAVHFSNVADSTPGNNRSCAAIEPLLDADLEIVKSVNNSKPQPDGAVIFTLTVTNKSLNSVTDVTIADKLPAGVTLHNSNPSGTWNAGTRTLIWTNISLAAGEQKQFIITSTAAAEGIWTNHATITNSSNPDANQANNTEQETLCIQNEEHVYPDLEVNKTASPVAVASGGSVVFTITVTNHGPGSGANVQVTDLWQNGFDFVSCTALPGNGSYDPSTGIWNLGGLAPLASAILTIHANAHQQGMIANPAVITQMTPGDADLRNNSDQVWVNVGDQDKTDLEIEKNLATANPLLGSPVVYQIILTNHGPNNAYSIKVLDKLPIGIEYISHSGSGVYSPASGVWAVDTLMNGASVSLQITALLKTSNVDNYAFILSSSTRDDKTENNSSCAMVQRQNAIDTRMNLVSNTHNSPVAGQGEIVFAIEAHSKNGQTYQIGMFADSLQFDPTLGAAISHMDKITFSNRYFNAVYQYNASEHYDMNSRILRYRYTWNGMPLSAMTAIVQDPHLFKALTPLTLSGNWTEILRIRIQYSMCSERSSISWTADTTDFKVLSGTGMDITGAEVGEMIIDIPLPVEISMFSATVIEDYVELHWITRSETENLGFNIYRADKNRMNYGKINESLIEGLGASEVGKEYKFQDHDMEFGQTYYFKLADVDFKGNTHFYNDIKEVVMSSPTEYTLLQNYPNPFNPMTRINFTLKKSGLCDLAIYNMNGQKVRTLTSGYRHAGSHTVVWDGKNESGNVMPSGIYLYKLRINGYIETRKMEFLK